MFVKPDCVPCYLKQSISTLRAAGVPEDEINGILYRAWNVVPELNTQATPCENSSIVLHKIYELIGCSDPYRKAKTDWNQYALKQYPRLVDMVESSSDRLLTAFKISVAGNIIDMGITPDFDVNLALGEITGKKFDYSDYDEFMKLLEKAESILVIGDNSGEIVFDKVLVREFRKRGLEVVYAVKKGPILNDATMEDAAEVELDGICRVITNGNNYLGTSLNMCSPEFLTVLKKADIVICKGQANFESLESSPLVGTKTFFVLRAKCQLVADCLGVALGSIVLKRNVPQLSI